MRPIETDAEHAASLTADHWLDCLDRRCVVATRRIALVGVAGMLAVSLVTVGDVLSRYFANAPIQGFYEMVELLMAVAISACFPVGCALRNHLKIDFLSTRLEARTTEALTVAGSFLLLLFFAVVAWRIGEYAWILRGRDEVTLVADWPVAPFWWLVTGFLVLSVPVQAVSFAAQLRAWLVRDSENGRAAIKFAAVGLAAIALLSVGNETLAGLLPSDPILIALVSFVVMFALTMFFIPVGAAMGLVGLLGFSIIVGVEPALHTLGTEPSTLLVNLDLAALPLFMLMGSFAAVAGLSNDVYELAHKIIGHRRGGLALATIGGCAGFGAVCGSSLATAATMGRVAMPEMRGRGYSPALTTGCVAAGGTLGMLVPPSSMMIIYAFLTETSVGELFIAALIPAAIAVAFYMTTIQIYVRLSPGSAPQSDRVPVAAVLKALVKTWEVMVLFALVMGGLYGGVFTATEAAAVGAGGAFLSALLRRKLPLNVFWEVLGDTASNTAMLYILVFAATIFSKFITMSLLPGEAVGFMQSLGLPALGVIFLILLMYLFLGAIMDPITMLLITIPVVIPVIAELGYDLIWWGIITVIIVELGLITPPIGINVFVIKGIAGDDVPLSTVFRGVTPFLTANLIKLVILTLFPIIVLWLPETMK